MTIAEDVARCIAVPATHPSGSAASTNDPTGDAVISECGTYRYFLTRRWRPGSKGVLWNMLNPSTADHIMPDATVRKVIGFSSRWGFDWFGITNTRPYRSQHPLELREWRRSEPKAAMDAAQLQDDYALEALRHVTRVVLGWGANGVHDPARCGFHTRMFTRRADTHVEVGHLGLTGDGHPKHPLMLSYDTPFTPYSKAV